MDAEGVPGDEPAIEKNCGHDCLVPAVGLGSPHEFRVSEGSAVQILSRSGWSSR